MCEYLTRRVDGTTIFGTVLQQETWTSHGCTTIFSYNNKPVLFRTFPYVQTDFDSVIFHAYPRPVLRLST